MKTRIIRHLKSAEGFVSGEDLSRTLSVSRAAVWKAIEELRAEGYEVEAVPHQGYRLAVAPDKLTASEVQFKLYTRKFGCHVHHFESIPSTMDEAFRLGMEGAPEGTVVVAETQAKGRGRMGRHWASPKGKGIYFSIILRPKCGVQDVSRLTLLAAVAVQEAVELATELVPLIKWPNDILLNGKKLCGILTELRAEVDKVAFVVVGIGLNVNNTASQLLPEATSIRMEKGEAFSRLELFQGILNAFERRYLPLHKHGYATVLAKWRTCSATLGKKVRFSERGKALEGVAVDIAEDGGLLIKLASGDVIKKMAGDVLL